MTTEDHYLPTCDPRLRPEVSSKLYPFTPRRAIDSSGCLGSFYNACCEQVLSKSNLHFTSQRAESQRSPHCYIPKWGSEGSSNLLDCYNIHDELRLSVALQMIQEVGVGGLANYSGSIDKYTRIICYNYYGYTEYISDDEFNLLKRNKIPMSHVLATHVIVLVNYGICAVAVLQLPRDQDIDKIDRALKTLCSSLSSDQVTTYLSQKHRQHLEKVVQTEVFSSIHDLAKIKSIVDFYDVILRIKDSPALFKPHNYSLCSVESLYIMHNGSNGRYIQLLQQPASEIEDYLLQLSSSLKKLRKAMDENYPNLEQKLKNQLLKMRTKWSNLEHMHMCEVQRFCNIVVDVRRGAIDNEMIYQALNDNNKKEMIRTIDRFEYKLITMQEKEQLIGDLLKTPLEYRDASEYGVENGDNEQIIERKLLSNGEFDCVICFNDISLNTNKSAWEQLVAEIINKHNDNPQLRFIYIDLSSCCRKPNYFVILSKDEKKDNISSTELVTPSSPSVQSKGDGTINILLLGESGVGKSTFINAFVNYLTFNTLEQAERNPVVLISVYFLMTDGDDFQERPVKFSKEDDLYNEDYEHTGQSVTQHCKSYVFTLQDGNSRERKVRIIDTPGIGDVRGVTQDDINMQHILSYITNLTHLNAVCILMKPNNARLNIFFRSCFTQLFDLLGENARDKIIFCFTNSRSTFYTPGDTGPLLKKLLDSLPIKGIPFTKQNTFCFDSESFRYLVAKRNGIKFGDLEEKDYNDSWIKSSTESKHFLESIRTKMTSSLFPGEFKSIKDAQLKIAVLSRPILESMRNIYRNIILWNNGSHEKSIELRPKVIEGPYGICLKCPQTFIEIEGFWIRRESLHVFHNICRTCECAPSDHYTIDYQLEYRPCDRPVSQSYKEMTQMVHDLCQSSTHFDYFLVEVAGIPGNDPFFAGIERMIKEEHDTCQNQSSHQLNLSLLECLEQLKIKYEEMKKKLLAKKERIELPKIYDIIEVVNKYEVIKCQMAAAKQWHKFMIKRYECEVSS